MDTWKETLLAYWNNQLIRFNPDQLAGRIMPPEAKDVLQELGLPEIAIRRALEFSVDKELSLIEFNGERYIRLGNNVGDNNLGIFVCMKEGMSEIFQMHTKYDPNVFFMNSDLKSLLLFMHAYAQFLEGGANLDEDDPEKNEMVARLKDEFSQIDPKALEGDNYYWAFILIELESF
jgi:hypothetical protein